MSETDNKDKESTENTDSENVGSTEELESKVHSANDWEHADLGDKTRKEKFLKLMGASKAEHKGKIVIGESKPQHKGDDPEKTSKVLESQFQQGLEHKLKGGYKSHLGLGFNPEDKKEEDKKEESNDGTDTPSVEAVPDTDIVEERRRVSDDTEKDNGQSESMTGDKRKSASASDGEKIPQKKAMMNFVKASDS